MQHRQIPVRSMAAGLRPGSDSRHQPEEANSCRSRRLFFTSLGPTSLPRSQPGLCLSLFPARALTRTEKHSRSLRPPGPKMGFRVPCLTAPPAGRLPLPPKTLPSVSARQPARTTPARAEAEKCNLKICCCSPLENKIGG